VLLLVLLVLVLLVLVQDLAFQFEGYSHKVQPLWLLLPVAES
jgi:hypothetical protein